VENPENGGACFPPFPQTLEIERDDFHIPSAPGRDDEYNSSFKTRKDKNPASPTHRFLQAHPWIGKDSNVFRRENGYYEEVIPQPVELTAHPENIPRHTPPIARLSSDRMRLQSSGFFP
jgi:hypothetical protein